MKNKGGDLKQGMQLKEVSVVTNILKESTLIWK